MILSFINYDLRMLKSVLVYLEDFNIQFRNKLSFWVFFSFANCLKNVINILKKKLTLLNWVWVNWSGPNLVPTEVFRSAMIDFLVLK